MQGYQIHATAVATSYLRNLYAMPESSLTRCMASGELFFAPSSPGHVRRLRPYPPSRRRRR